VRRVIRILVVLSMGFATAGFAEVRDQLVMPFECDLVSGRIKLSPSAEKRYPIVGGREERAVTTCHPPRSLGCRTIMVHRFVIPCGGTRVAWMRVATAIRRAADAPVWIENGRMNLVVPVRHAGAKAPCFGRPEFARTGMGLTRRVAFTRNCAPAARDRDFDQVALPAGFAPVGEIGARLLFATAASGPAGAAEENREAAQAPSASQADAEGETLVAKADPDVIVEPIPGLEPYGAAIEPAVAADDWVTVVRAASEYGTGGRDESGGAPGTWAWVLAVLSLATAAGLVRTRLAYARKGRLFAFALRLARAIVLVGKDRWGNLRRASPIRGYTNAGAAVAALVQQTEAVVSGLKGAGPLREVLQGELKRVRQQLASVEANAGEGEEAAAETAPLFRALVHDLERIRRIADSAAASLSRVPQAAGLPRTISEAYDVLGVNPDVSEGVLKKIVDALRMSWHPDHARDEGDRRVREHRIRQINIAWELVNAKREAA